MSDPIVTFDEAAMRGAFRELVGRTVEDALNALLEEEADDLVSADRYERTAHREAHPHEQRHRAAEPRDLPPHASGGRIPHRQERPHAGGRQAEVRGRQRVGVEEVHGLSLLDE